ncbi:phytanoyl-CoA dioxygenase family protein [Phenylobacterium sp.]|uniref:phytanoyl-CoA dioxygenase family protein n=1 Tax=Phenylobacterium sp. TaxID=1871053 RepID=UPI0035B42EFF
MPALKHLSADASPEEIREILDTDGALILDHVIPRAQVDAVMAELMPYIEATPTGADDFSGVKTTRTGALVARSPQARKLVTHPAMLAGADAFLLRYCSRYQLHLTQVIRIRPGQPKQPLHRDRLAWGGWVQGVEPQFNTIWAMTDFTEENGATQVVPGSPGWAEGRQAEPHEVGYAQMERGSVLVYSGSVIHAGGENRSGGDRIGVNITYCLGWLRQEENQYLSCPPQIARDLDPELQALLGYAMGSYALGYYTPPLPPGEGPEIVPPEHALGDTSGAGWGAALTPEARRKLASQL